MTTRAGGRSAGGSIRTISYRIPRSGVRSDPRRLAGRTVGRCRYDSSTGVVDSCVLLWLADYGVFVWFAAAAAAGESTKLESTSSLPDFGADACTVHRYRPGVNLKLAGISIRGACTVAR